MARDDGSTKTDESQLTAESLQQAIDGLRRETLDPIAPEDAVEMYLSDREQELRDSSLETHRSGLSFFCDWAEEQGLDNLNELTGRDLHQYRVWRREEAPTKVESLGKQAEKSQQDIIRQFIKHAESIDAVPSGLHEKVRSPSIPDEEASRSAIVEGEQAQAILDWLTKYEYCSYPHVVWEILANTGLRIGALVALDVKDYSPEADIPHLRIRHRPDSGTQLKNGKDGERCVSLSSRVCEVLDDFLDQQHPNITDDNGREPLLATQHGRISRSTIRKYVYMKTRPCEIGQGCPHDRDPESCEATTAHSASKCPSSESPHAIRRGYITHELKSGVDRSYVSGRCNVSEEVIEQHYDERDEQEKMEVRRQVLKNTNRSRGNYGGAGDE